MAARRLGSLIVSIMMLAALIVGCSKGNAAKENNATQTGSQPESAGSEVTAQPGEDYPTSLTYWIELGGEVVAVMKSYSEHPFYQTLEQKTNTKVEFQHPSGEVAEQFNLLLASRKLPDLIYYNWFTVPKGPASLVKDNVIIRLNELIKTHAPNLNKYLEEHPELVKEISLDDGTIYTVPSLDPDAQSAAYIGPTYRKDWLERVGLGVPTTIDDWHAVLKAFKETDMNGNGEKDEIPLLLNNLDAWSSAWGVSTSFINDNGTVKYGPIEPGFKSFLIEMNKWFEEGLIDKDYLATDAKLRDAKVTGEKLGTFVWYVASGLGRYMDQMADVNPDFALAGAPFPVLERNEKNRLGLGSPPFIGEGTAITSAAANPEKIIRWLDFAYSPEGRMMANFGVEGVSYTLVDGEPVFTDTIMKNPDGLAVTQAIAKYALSAAPGPYIYDFRVSGQIAPRQEQTAAKKEWAKATGEMLMPGVTLNEAEATSLGNMMTDISTYYEEMVHKFIMGLESIDKFDAYVQTIKEMKIAEAIQIQQAALDRYNNR